MQPIDPIDPGSHQRHRNYRRRGLAALRLESRYTVLIEHYPDPDRNQGQRVIIL